MRRNKEGFGCVAEAAGMEADAGKFVVADEMETVILVYCVKVSAESVDGGGVCLPRGRYGEGAEGTLYGSPHNDHPKMEEIVFDTNGEGDLSNNCFSPIK
jgi:hypothetical protein